MKLKQLNLKKRKNNNLILTLLKMIYMQIGMIILYEISYFYININLIVHFFTI